MVDPRAQVVVDEDLEQIVALAVDLQFYRSVAQNGGLGGAAYLELRRAVAQLPEARE